MGFRTAQDRRLHRAIAEIQGSPLSCEEALQRLTADPRDARSLIAIYERHRLDFKETTIRWFGRDRELQKRALNQILLAIARQARTYDPRRMDAADWIRECAETEAFRLRKIFNFQPDPIPR
jgi:hypothetical protein